MADYFEIEVLEPFGVRIHADLAEPLEPEAAAELLRLIDRHGIAIIPDQSLTMAQQRRLMSNYGRIPQRDLVNVSLDDGVLNGDAMAYHSDFAFGHTPYRNLSLHAVEIEGPATSTRFANGALAYSKLSAARRALLARLTTTAVSGMREERAYLAEAPEGAFSAVRAAVIYHPRTSQPILYLNEAMHIRFNELDRADSDALLGELFELLYAPDAILEHVWSVGDLLIFDNLILQHGRPDLGNMSRRRLQRVSIADVEAAEMFPEYLDGEGLPEVTM